MSAIRDFPRRYITRNCTFEITSSITGDAGTGVQPKMSVFFFITEMDVTNWSSQTRGLYFPFNNVDMFIRRTDSMRVSIDMLNNFHILDATLFHRLTGEIATKLTEVANEARDGSRGDCVSLAVYIFDSYRSTVQFEEEEVEVDPEGEEGNLRAHVLHRLEKARYDSGVGYREKDCAICLQDFCHGEEIAKVPCSHIFHEKCLSRWMVRAHVCPLCRYDLSKEC